MEVAACDAGPADRAVRRLHLPLARHLDTVPDTGDPLLNTWALSWIAHQAPIAPARLVHANIFYPERYAAVLQSLYYSPG